MTRAKERAPVMVQRAIRLQYEKDRLLLEQRAQVEQRSENARRGHEWRMMVTEKGLFAIIVGLTLWIATISGNVLVEHYKNDATLQQARAQVVRQATNEVWNKLIVCEESVSEFGNKIDTQRWHKDLDMFKDEVATDQKNADDANTKAKQSCSDVWDTLRSQELNLGPGMHGVFFRAMQDISMTRNVYESDETRGRRPDKLSEDVIEGNRHDLEKIEQFISSVMSQP